MFYCSLGFFIRKSADYLDLNTGETCSNIHCSHFVEEEIRRAARRIYAGIQSIYVCIHWMLNMYAESKIRKKKQDLCMCIIVISKHLKKVYLEWCIIPCMQHSLRPGDVPAINLFHGYIQWNNIGKGHVQTGHIDMYNIHCTCICIVREDNE